MPKYHPSPRDIIHVSALLSCTPLPPELIDTILEQAEYWARITARLDNGTLLTAHGGRNEHRRLLRIKPICSGAADQGKGTEGDKRKTRKHEETTPALSTERGLTASIISGFSALTGAIRTVIGLDHDDSDTDSNAESLGTRAEYYASLPDRLVPEPRGRHPVRRITWKIRSHDQGWGGEYSPHIYGNSWTGFRGAVSRFKPKSDSQGKAFDHYGSPDYLEFSSDSAEEQERPPTSAPQQTVTVDNAPSGSENDGGAAGAGDGEVVPAQKTQAEVWPQGEWPFKEMQIQLNRRANGSWKDHHIVWDHRDDIDEDDPRATLALKARGRGLRTGDGSLVTALSRGDIIELWSYAFFPGWANHVQEAEVVVEFAL